MTKKNLKLISFSEVKSFSHVFIEFVVSDTQKTWLRISKTEIQHRIKYGMKFYGEYKAEDNSIWISNPDREG